MKEKQGQVVAEVWKGPSEPQVEPTLERPLHAPAESIQEDVSPHGVDDHVHPVTAHQLPHCLLQAALTVVDAGLCAPLHGQLALLVTSSGSYYLHKEHKASEFQNTYQEGLLPSNQPAATGC